MIGPAVEIATLGLAIGLVFGLLCYLVTNLSPGGMITPGWLALALVATPERLVTIGLVTGVTWVATLGARRVIILYGKRLFATVVLLAVFTQLTLVLGLAGTYPRLVAGGETLGFIIPGLMAYQLVRQPTIPTILAIGSVTSLAYGVMVSAVLLGFVPETQTGFTRRISDAPLGVGPAQVALIAFATLGFIGALAWSLRRVRRAAEAPSPILAVDVPTPRQAMPDASDRLRTYLAVFLPPWRADTLADEFTQLPGGEVAWFRAAHDHLTQTVRVDVELSAEELSFSGGLTMIEIAAITGLTSESLRARFQGDLDRRSGPR